MFTPEKNIFSILGRAFSVYGKNIKYLFVITLMAFVPVFAFRMAIPHVYYEAHRDMVGAWFSSILVYGYAPSIIYVVLSMISSTYFMIFWGIEVVFFPISVAAATYLVFKHQKDEEPTFGGMFTAALPILPKMMVTSAIAFAFIYFLFSATITFFGGFFGGFLLFISLYIAAGMVFYQHIVADVGRWGLNAISLSRYIVRGRWFKVFFGTILIFVCYGLLALFSDFFLVALGVRAGTPLHLAFFLLQHLLLSYFAIAFAMWYFDIKRFHTLNFQEIEKDLMEKMRQHMDRFGREEDEADEGQSDDKDDNEKN